MDQNRASLAADLLPGISVVGLGCSAPLGSLEMPARVWGPWAQRRARRKSCEQHSALGGAPALLRGEGAEGRSVFPPISPKGILQDTVCSLVFDNKEQNGAGCCFPSFTSRQGWCLPVLLSSIHNRPPALVFLSHFLSRESCWIPPGSSARSIPGSTHPHTHPLLYLHLGVAHRCYKIHFQG